MPQKAILSNNFFWKGSNSGSLQDCTHGLSKMSYNTLPLLWMAIKSSQTEKKITTEICAASKNEAKIKKTVNICLL